VGCTRRGVYIVCRSDCSINEIFKEARKTAEGLSHYISTAWAALKDPLPRAEYILKLHGIEITEEDQLDDPGLIWEIMEIREELENADPIKVRNIAEANRGACSPIKESNMTNYILV
jgi:hypothetical protein